MIRLFIAVFLFLCFGSVAQDVKFIMPLKGISSSDYFICRYVDHDPRADIFDAYCGTKTYDGHGY